MQRIRTRTVIDLNIVHSGEVAHPKRRNRKTKGDLGTVSPIEPSLVHQLYTQHLLIHPVHSHTPDLRSTLSNRERTRPRETRVRNVNTKGVGLTRENPDRGNGGRGIYLRSLKFFGSETRSLLWTLSPLYLKLRTIRTGHRDKWGASVLGLVRTSVLDDRCPFMDEYGLPTRLSSTTVPRPPFTGHGSRLTHQSFLTTRNRSLGGSVKRIGETRRRLSSYFILTTTEGRTSSRHSESLDYV